MADDLTHFPVPTKNILDLIEAEIDFEGDDIVEVINDGNSRRRVMARKHDTELTGNPRGSTPDPDNDSNSLATTEWVWDTLENYDFDNDPEGPPPPENLNLVARTIVDRGSGKIIIRVIVTFDLPPNPKDQWRYAVRWTEDGEPDSVVIEGNRHVIEAQSGSEYVVKVRTVGKNRKGEWSDTESIIPLKKMLIPPRPSGLDAFPGHKRVRLKWDDPRETNPEFTDYFTTRIYRSKTNNFEDATVAGNKSGTKDVDDGLDNNETYFYWISHIDTSKNQSAIFPNPNNGVEVKTRRLKDEDSDDDDIPGKPRNLLLTPRTEITDDGGLKLSLIATFDPPNGGLSNKGGYIIYIREQGSEDRDTRNLDRDERSVKFGHVRSSRTYIVKVRAKNGMGQLGDWTDTVQITLDKKANYNTGVPLGLTAYAGFKSNFILWPELEGLDALDYAKTVIMRSPNNNFSNAIEVGRVHGTAFRDGGLGNKQNFYYWIYNLDRSKNASPRYPAAPATNNGVLATTDAISDDDISELIPNAPSDVLLSAGSLTVVDSKVIARTKATWSAPVGGAAIKFYKIRITEVETNETKVRETSDASELFYTFTCKPGKEYSVRVAAVTKLGERSAFTTPISFTRNKKGNTIVLSGTVTASPGKKRVKVSWDAVDDDVNPDYKITHLFRKTNSTPPVLGVTAPYKKVKGDQVIDDDLPNATNFNYWIAHKDDSGNYSALSAMVGPVQSGGSEVSSFNELTGQIDPVTQIPTGSIPDTATSTTAPGNPTSLGLGQAPKDKDAGDGTVKIAGVVSWAAPASGVAVASYEVAVYDGSNTTYPVISGQTARFEAVVGRTYSVTIKAISKFGVKSSGVTVSGWSPSGNPNAPNAPTGTASATAGGFKVYLNSWGTFANPDDVYVQVSLASGSPTPSDYSMLVRSDTTFFPVDYPGVSSYSIWARTFNRSNVPSSWTLIRSSLVSGAPWIANGSIDENKLATNSVSNTKLQSNSVSRASLQQGAAGGIAINSLGTGTGNVNAGSGSMTLLAVTFRVTANGGSGKTVNLGNMSWGSLTLTVGVPYTFATVENGGGSFGFSRGGNFDFANCQLCASTVY